MTPEEILAILPDKVPYNPERQYQIGHAGKVDKLTFQILVGLFMAIGLAAVIGRIVLYTKNRGKLYLDDYLVLFAAVCLVVESTILLYYCDMIYTIVLLMLNPLDIFQFGRLEILEVLDFLKWTNVFLVFSWTANYAIKFSFLAFFRVLVRGVSRRLNWYWWLVFVFTLASWLFNIVENFAHCGATGSFKCFPHPEHFLAISITCTAANIIADLMIVCIPIILLQKSQLRLGQKLRILTFLCLNIFMCAFALGRHIGGMYRDRQGGFLLQMSWSTLWLHLESSVAVLMGGVTALRTVFATQDRERKRRNTNSLSSSLYYRFRRFIKRSESPYNESPSLIGPNGEFLAGPQTGGTLKGVKTFIRRFNRTAGVTTYASRDDPDYNTLDDYHSFRRLEKRDGVSESTLAFSHSGDENKYLQPLPRRPLPTLQTHNLI